jgi:hypothetical protein
VDLTPDDLVETSYSLLFLARGRHPILMNKLRFDGHWANRPRDVANLARFASSELERPLNWQVVSIDRDWTDWSDAPILYLASHEAPKLKENDYVKLKRFVEAGGMLFTQADGGSEAFNKFVGELSKKLFPTFEWADLPKDHDIYTINFHVNPQPKLRFVSNGSRILMLHSPDDISQHWQLRADKSKRNLFELGVNLFIYAAGKTDLRNRLDAHDLPEPPGERSFALRVARVKYNGQWDPEPGAWKRFANWFEYQTGYGLIVSMVEPSQLNSTTHPLAHLTGTAAWTPSDDEIAALRKYVESGGTLIIDACGGAVPFGQSVSGNIIPRGFAKATPLILDNLHPLLAGKADGMEALPRPGVRIFADQKLGKSGPRMELYSAGHGHVIYSALDLTTALLNTNTWAVFGYRPSYAQSFIKNAILWTLDGGADQ